MKKWQLFLVVTVSLAIGAGGTFAVTAKKPQTPIAQRPRSVNMYPRPDRTTPTGIVGQNLTVGHTVWRVSESPTIVDAEGVARVVGVDITFLNDGKEPEFLDLRQVRLNDSQGREYHPEEPPRPDDAEYQWLRPLVANPGVYVGGHVEFYVAAEASGLKLKLSDNSQNVGFIELKL